MTAMRHVGAPLLFTLLALSTHPLRSVAQPSDSVHSDVMSLPCRVPLPRHPAGAVTLDVAMLERCSERPLPHHFRILADTANEAGVIQEAAVVVANQFYRQYTLEGDLGNLVAGLAYVRMAEQTLGPPTHGQALFLGRAIAYELAARLAARADSSGSCDWWRAAQLFTRESLRYRVIENTEFGPSIQSRALHLDSLATARFEGRCRSRSGRSPPNDSLELTSGQRSYARQLLPWPLAAQFKR